MDSVEFLSNDITIVIIVDNHSIESIKDTIKSVYVQSFSSWNILIFNISSKKTVCSFLSQIRDPKITVINSIDIDFEVIKERVESAYMAIVFAGDILNSNVLRDSFKILNKLCLDTLVIGSKNDYLTLDNIFNVHYDFVIYKTRILSSISLTFDDRKNLLQLLPESKIMSTDLAYHPYLSKFKDSLSGDIKFSIVMPTYNTDPIILNKAIESVLSQTYDNWELCIADGNSNQQVKDILSYYSNRDQRIKVKFLDQNYGISGNSNHALQLATGDFIALMDHDDTLAPIALEENYKVIKDKNPDYIFSDEDKIDDNDNRYDVFFKPDFGIDTLRSYNYMTHFSVFRKSVIDAIKGFRNFEGSQDYDLILRVVDYTKNIYHIPKVLYHWRATKGSTAKDPQCKQFAYVSAIKALQDHLQRNHIDADVTYSELNGTYRIKYVLKNQPLVSMIIPTRNHYEDLVKCISSIINKTLYKNYEIIIADNESTDEKTLMYLDSLKYLSFVKVVSVKGDFNFSRINNIASKYCNGKYLLLLNNDTEVINEEWLSEMVSIANRDEVGVVGAKLLYYDNTIQHAGVVIGLGGICGHIHKNLPSTEPGYFNRVSIVSNLSAVTAACMLVKKDLFELVQGLDDQNLPVAFNDIDLCLKIRELNKLIVYTPFAQLYHYESKSRGYEDTQEKVERFQKEISYFSKKWRRYLCDGDPYYNVNLDLNKDDSSYKDFDVYEDWIKHNEIVSEFRKTYRTKYNISTNEIQDILISKSLPYIVSKDKKIEVTSNFAQPKVLVINNYPDLNISYSNAKCYSFTKDISIKQLDEVIRKSNTDFILLLLDAIEVNNSYIDNMISVYNPVRGLIGGRVLDSKNRRTKYIGSILINDKIYDINDKSPLLTYSREHSIMEVDAISTYSMFFSKQIYLKVNGFRYVDNFNIEFAKSIVQLGFKVIYNPYSESYI
ncbi:MAG: glycosyltransferase family 2 protein [Conexivisphaerales archaeon]